MKTKMICLLMLCITIGMVITAFAGSPNKNEGDKTKTDCTSSTPPPPTTWDFNIIVTDPSDSCDAILYCNLGFFYRTSSH